MSFDIEDILGTYLLLDFPILRDEDQRETFIDQIREELHVEALERDSNLAIPSLRIYLDLQGSQTIIKRDYPKHDDDLKDLASVIDIAFSIAGLQNGGDRSFTLSTWLVYHQVEDSNAGIYLGKRVLKRISLDDLGMRAVGGTATYHTRSIDDESTMWVARFEPRYSDPDLARVYLDLDWHHVDVALPSGRDEILDCLQKIRSIARSFIEMVHSND